MGSINISSTLGTFIAAALAFHLVTCLITAGYGRDRGHPFFPVFLAALFIGFPIPLLAVAVTRGTLLPPRFGKAPPAA